MNYSHVLLCIREIKLSTYARDEEDGRSLFPVFHQGVSLSILHGTFTENVFGSYIDTPTGKNVLPLRENLVHWYQGFISEMHFPRWTWLLSQSQTKPLSLLNLSYKGVVSWHGNCSDREGRLIAAEKALCARRSAPPTFLKFSAK